MTRVVAPGELDRVTRAFLRRCADPDDPLRTAWATADLGPVLRAMFGGRMLSRPLFVPHKTLERAAADVAVVFRLLTELPDRLFGGDLDRYCAALGIDGRKRHLVTRLGGAPPPRYGRADMAFDGERFRLLEFNVGSDVGGVANTIARQLLGVPAFREFAVEHGLRTVATGRLVAQALRAAAAPAAGHRDPVVALLEAPGGLARYGPGWHSLAELMRRQGLDFLVGEVDDVTWRGGRPRLDDRGIDLVVRCFTAEELLAVPGGEAMAEPIFRAHENGDAVLWTPLEAELFDNKICLAMLCGSRDRLDPADRAVLDRVLPWSRPVPARPDPEFFAECLSRQQELIVKPAAGFGGSGVVAGWEVTPRQWAAALAGGAATPRVVQQRVAFRPEPVADPGTGEVGVWRAVWGLFVTPAGFAGANVRAAPDSAGAVVSLGAGGHIGGVFSYPA